MADERTLTAEDAAAAELAARESSPLPWSAQAYFNVAVDPIPQHGIKTETRVGVAAHAPGLYFSDYGPIATPIDTPLGRKGSVSGG